MEEYSSAAKNYRIDLAHDDLSDKDIVDIMATVWHFCGGDVLGFYCLQKSIEDRIEALDETSN